MTALALGHQVSLSGSRQMTITFDPDSFDEIRAFAEKRGITFGSAVRHLIEIGLEEAKE